MDKDYLCIKCNHNNISQSESICYEWKEIDTTPYGLCCCSCVFPDGKTALQIINERLKKDEADYVNW